MSPVKENTAKIIFTVDESEQKWTPLAFEDDGDAVDLRLVTKSLGVQIH